MFTGNESMVNIPNGKFKSGFHVITFKVVYLCYEFVLTHGAHIQICKQKVQSD